MEPFNEFECTFDVLGKPTTSSFTAAEKCQIAELSCSPAGFINFYHLYFC